MAEEPKGLSPAAEASALAELALCENLSQTSGWAARWSAQLSGADAVLLWAPDALHPLFLCIGAYGEGTKGFLRRSVSREIGLVHDLLRDRKAVLLESPDFASSTDPWLKDLPATTQTCIAVPLEAEGVVVGLLALLFSKRPQTQATLSRLDGFLRQAAPALARALRAERKTVGMLHAIERLTNLYDLSKAFGSTIDLEELNQIIVRKAVDFATAEVGSFWLLEESSADVVLAATAVNENYEVATPPDAVGGSIVGDLIADKTALRRNRIPADDPLAQEDEGYPVHSVLAFALVEEDRPVGALVLVNKRGRHPEFSPEDEELLQDLARQAVRALRNARQYEAEKKVEELDALLAVSREITATLDLDRVMQTIVNASAALIRYDRCAVAILRRGRLRIGAVSGTPILNRNDIQIRRLEELLEWVYYGGSDVAVHQEESGRVVSERPENEEKFRVFFHESELRSFYGVLLKDEEGKLGVLSFESKTPVAMERASRDLLDILVNQATVAVRNAQLYQQVPLAGFLKPLLEKRRRIFEIPKSRRFAWGAGTLLALVVLFLVPWNLRVGGAARILPGHRSAVTAGVDGVISAMLRKEGDSVTAGDVIATLKDESYLAEAAEARSGLDIVDSEIARYREAADSAAVFQAQARRQELAARIALTEDRLGKTRLRAPISGVIVTPHVEERIGQYLKRGEELCVVADLGTVVAEIAVPEVDASLLHEREPVDLKLNPYPTRTFRGEIVRIGARVRDVDRERFVVAEASVETPGGLLKTGMLGRAKVSTGRVSLATALLRQPLRYVWKRIWPLLP